MSPTTPRPCSAGATLDDTALALEKITIGAWTAVVRASGDRKLDEENRLALQRMVDALREDLAALEFATSRGRAGTPPRRLVSRRETLLELARRAARRFDSELDLVEHPQEGAERLARDLESVGRGDREVAERLDPFLKAVHRLTSQMSSVPGERLLH